MRSGSSRSSPPSVASKRRSTGRAPVGAPPVGPPSVKVPRANAEMLALVRASGLKLTPQRIAIVREIASDPTHPTAQELYERLLPSMPTMSFATVYNTLDALAVAGLCSVRALSPGPSRFDPNMIAHDHAVCDACGLVRDVAAQARSDASGAAPHDTREGRPISSKGGPIPGFSVHAVEQIYRGICADCERRRRGKKPGSRATTGKSAERKHATA